jgi:hypothetical protein
MNEKRTLVVGVFHDRIAAHRGYDALLNRGFFDTDINVLMSEQTRDLFGNEPIGRKAEIAGAGGGSKAAEGMGIGGAVGTAVGGSIAALVAVGTSLVLPGLNLVIAGPLAAALAGGGAGAVAGGLLGGLVGLGIPEDGAEMYHAALRSGGTILGVSVADDELVNQVKQVLKDCGAEHVRSV